MPGYTGQHPASIPQQGVVASHQGFIAPEQQQQQLRPGTIQQQQPPAGHVMQAQLQQAAHAMHSDTGGMHQQVHHANAYATGPYAPHVAHVSLTGPPQHVPCVPQQPQAAAFGSAVGAGQQALVGPRSHAGWKHSSVQEVLFEQQMLSARQQVLQNELAAVLQQQQHLNAVAQGLFRDMQQPR